MSVLVWEDDIGWCERAKKELAKEGIAMREVDHWGMLLEEVQKEVHRAAVLSLEQLMEEFSEQNWEMKLSELCKKSRVPVLLVSDCRQEERELVVLCAGADDYIMKEKDIRIFVTRLKNSFFKKKESEYSNTDYPDIYENISARQIKIGARKIPLTPKEMLVFHCFVHSKDKILSREEILFAVWENHMPKCGRVVDTVVKQLRYKMRETQYAIRSLYKRGYYLERQ